jgi:hypothetical protein
MPEPTIESITNEIVNNCSKSKRKRTKGTLKKLVSDLMSTKKLCHVLDVLNRILRLFSFIIGIQKKKILPLQLTEEENTVKSVCWQKSLNAMYFVQIAMQKNIGHVCMNS